MDMTPALRQDLKRTVGDYAIDEDTLIAIFTGKFSTFSLNREKICYRLLLGTPWYRLLDHFGPAGIREMLTDNVIRQFWIKDLREKFGYAKDALNALS